MRVDTVVHIAAGKNSVRVYMLVQLKASEVKLETVICPVSDIMAEDDELSMIDVMCKQFNEMVRARMISDYERGK